MNKQTAIDWHSADVIAALKKRGTSLAKLSREAGLASSTLANALVRPWPKGEWLIAAVIGLHPEEIWPSRYVKERQKRAPKSPLPICICIPEDSTNTQQTE
ncbi:DNA-binding transcriptional regulator Nlp [Leminorella richardii]|uniref:DNA-binding transcriptional regulator Nlp n=1 Tax=Leminorella richardii TaxID=158841 RepID=A0A2X4V9X6_9GAMM|nr:helix-turn-helix transcriptional regulator [Leminorella richardii]SQI42120.1 DNA-binding transcriptional regulator Nlp [Leminorella richardii]